MSMPDFVFRGTTKDYPGNSTTIRLGNTCTSGHPVKAFFFAAQCSGTNSAEAAVYICRMSRVENFLCPPNVLSDQEDEFAFDIPPTSFYQQCIGYVRAEDMRTVLREVGIEVAGSVRMGDLSRLCSEAKDMEPALIEQIVWRLTDFMR